MEETETTTETAAATLGSATYSPDDNKLRFYPLRRLSSEDYGKIRGAGFAWAPKQELFAATWSPNREDLLLEWCGEIGDEDKSLVDRAEERAERFDGYSAKRREEATAARAEVSRISHGIPMGQPILVGHHSERHARRDAERIERGMQRAVAAWDTANYWKDRAAGAIRAARYKELPAVRARRIKGIEAEARKTEKLRKEHEFALRFWRGELKLKDGSALEISTANRETVCRILGVDHRLTLYVATEGGCSWSAWDVLRPDGERYPNTPTVTVEECRDVAFRVYPAWIAREDRWLAHYARRLDYERAMLAAEGGTAADKTKPEKGGACRCWASPRGGWSTIQKVNKVSVTVLDNWGNGGKDFTRTIPFDQLHAVMSQAQVEEARAAGRVMGETPRGFHLLSDAPMPPTPPPAAKDEAADFAALRAAAAAGVEVVVAPQLFPTPPPLAARMVREAEIDAGSVVLEPSAGTGNLLRAIRSAAPEAEVVAVELNPSLAGKLREDGGWRVVCDDFLTVEPPTPRPDRIVMNPPFANGEDVRHILRAWEILRPGGRLVALCAAGPRQIKALSELADQHGGTFEILPDGQFEEQGTSVRVALLSVDKAPELSHVHALIPQPAGQAELAFR